MASSLTLTSLLIALLLVLSSAGTVTLSNSNTVSVTPTTISLSSSYSLADGYTWNRQRGGSYSYFAEYYTLSVQSACVIKCGPYSWPVISGGRLYCERNLSYFNKNQPFTGNAYKALCIPHVTSNSGDCPFATYTISSTTGGRCSYSAMSSNSLYSSNSGNFDCCHNNDNPS